MYLWIKKLNRDEFNRIYACGDTNYGWKKLNNLTILKSSVSLKQEFKSFILNLNYETEFLSEDEFINHYKSLDEKYSDSCRNIYGYINSWTK